MNCPYCTQEISDAALACHHCGRELLFYRPIIERLLALEKRLEERLSRIESDIGVISQGATRHAISHALPTEFDTETQVRNSLRRDWLTALLLPLILLMTAHVLITQIWDTKDWVLYAASVAIPILPAYRLTRLHRLPLLKMAAFGFGMAIVAVLGMTGITAFMDHVSWFPTSAREWKELANYSISIALAFVGGGMAGDAMHGREIAKELARAESLHRMAGKLLDAEKMSEAMTRIDTLGKSAMALAATSASFYAGLGQYLRGQ